MFFMIGTWPGRKDLGMHSGYNIIMTYVSMVIFFIPLFKFQKRYFAQVGGQLYEIDSETGKAIERGEEPVINIDRSAGTERDFYGGNAGGTYGSGSDAGYGSEKICMRCGYTTSDPDFTHCPKCGNKLIHQKNT